jgi:hypothetical protein
LLLAVDGFDVDVPDTEENAAAFGYAGSGEKRSAFPKIRVVALAECGTHAFRAAEVGGYATGEKTLARGLLMRLRRDEVLTADRGFYSFDNWTLAAGTGADLIWRAPTGLNLPVIKVLADGTFITVLINPEITGSRRRRALLDAAKAGAELDPDEAHLVRVIEYDIPDRAGNGTGELVVLLTTILDPAQARADEVAAGYNERWGATRSRTRLSELSAKGKCSVNRWDVDWAGVWPGVGRGSRCPHVDEMLSRHAGSVGDVPVGGGVCWALCPSLRRSKTPTWRTGVLVPSARRPVPRSYGPGSRSCPNRSRCSAGCCSVVRRRRAARRRPRVVVRRSGRRWVGRLGSAASGKGAKGTGGGTTRTWTPGRKSMTCPRPSGPVPGAGRCSSRWARRTASRSTGG